MIMFMTSLIYQSICLLSNNLFCLSITFCWIWERTTVSCCVFPFIPRFISYVNWTGLAHQILQKSLCVYICQICVIYYLWILHQVIYLPGKEYFWKRWPYYVRCPQALLLRGSDQRIIQCWHAFKKILLLKLCVCMHITNFFFFSVSLFTYR